MRYWAALNGVTWMDTRLKQRVTRAGGTIHVRIVLRYWNFDESSVDDGIWASFQKPWEELPMMRRLWLAGVTACWVPRTKGGAVGVLT